MDKSFISTFFYNCDIAINSIRGKSIPIMKECVSYIMIDNNYKDNIMPIIYMKLRLLPSIYNIMVPEQGKSKIFIRLYMNRDKKSTSCISKKIIYDEFDYFMTDDPDGYKKMDESVEDKGITYKECFIGLIKLDLQRKNQRCFEGIFKNTDSMSLAQYATSNMKTIIQPFDFNTKYNAFVCPLISTIGQFLSFLNNENPFYKGSYTYYMDTNKTYLRSNDGSYIDANDNDFKYIAIDIRELTTKSAVTTGIVEDPSQDAYIIYVPSNDAKIIIDRVTSNLIGTVESISGTDGEIRSTKVIDTSKITGIDPGISKSIIISKDNNNNGSEYLTTKIVETSDTLIITKLDMDSSIFTLNKQYILCNYEDNPKHCGVYYMTRKQELYLRVGNEMHCQITLILKKCADFV